MNVINYVCETRSPPLSLLEDGDALCLAYYHIFNALHCAQVVKMLNIHQMNAWRDQGEVLFELSL